MRNAEQKLWRILVVYLYHLQQQQQQQQHNGELFREIKGQKSLTLQIQHQGIIVGDQISFPHIQQELILQNKMMNISDYPLKMLVKLSISQEKCCIHLTRCLLRMKSLSSVGENISLKPMALA